MRENRKKPLAADWAWWVMVFFWIVMGLAAAIVVGSMSARTSPPPHNVQTIDGGGENAP